MRTGVQVVLLLVFGIGGLVGIQYLDSSHCAGALRRELFPVAAIRASGRRAVSLTPVALQIPAVSPPGSAEAKKDGSATAPAKPKFEYIYPSIGGFYADFAREKLFVLFDASSAPTAHGLYIINMLNGAIEKTITGVTGDGPVGSVICIGANGRDIYLKAGPSDIAAISTRSNRMTLISTAGIGRKPGLSTYILGCGTRGVHLYFTVENSQSDNAPAGLTNSPVCYLGSLDTRNNIIRSCHLLPSVVNICTTAYDCGITFRPGRIYLEGQLVDGWSQAGTVQAFSLDTRTGKAFEPFCQRYFELSADGRLDLAIDSGITDLEIDSGVEDNIKQLDPHSGKIVAKFAKSWGNITFSSDDRLLYVPFKVPGRTQLSPRKPLLAVFFAASQKVLRFIPIKYHPNRATRCYAVPGGYDVLMAYAHNVSYNKKSVAKGGARGLSVINARNGEYKFTVPMSNPRIVQFSANGRYAYVVNLGYKYQRKVGATTEMGIAGSNYLVCIDTKTGRTVFRMPVWASFDPVKTSSCRLYLTPDQRRLIFSYRDVGLNSQRTAIINAKTGKLITRFKQLHGRYDERGLAAYDRFGPPQNPRFKKVYFLSKSGHTLCAVESDGDGGYFAFVTINTLTGKVLHTYKLPLVRIKVPPPDNSQNNEDMDPFGF